MNEPTMRELMDGFLNPTIPLEWKVDIAHELARRWKNGDRIGWTP